MEFERRKEALAETIPMAVKALTTAMIAMVITSWRTVTPASVFRVLMVISLPSTFMVFRFASGWGQETPHSCPYNECAKSHKLENSAHDFVARC